jgi:hypothetical protein
MSGRERFVTVPKKKQKNTMQTTPRIGFFITFVLRKPTRTQNHKTLCAILERQRYDK